MMLNGYLMCGSQILKFPHSLPWNPHSNHFSLVRMPSPKTSSSLTCCVSNACALNGKSSQNLGSSNSILHGDYNNGAYMMPSLNNRVLPRSSIIPSASKTFLTSYPKMTKRPKWWWRAAACFLYLLPLHKLWMHADSVYYLHKLLENWEFLVNPFIDTLVTMPSWVFMAILYCLYFFVVKRKECPHFLRFHVIMAMLVENAYEALAISCRWLPKTLFHGQLGMHFWLAVTLAQLYTVVECMCCALAGKYADAPFVSDAAYLHTDPSLLPS